VWFDVCREVRSNEAQSQPEFVRQQTATPRLNILYYKHDSEGMNSKGSSFFSVTRLVARSTMKRGMYAGSRRLQTQSLKRESAALDSALVGGLLLWSQQSLLSPSPMRKAGGPKD